MLRKLVWLGVLVALLGVGPVRAADDGRASPDGRRLVTIKHSLLGAHIWYQQTYRDLPVLDGFVVEHRAAAGSLRVDDGRLTVTSVPRQALVAARATRTLAAGRVESHQLSVQAPSRLVWSVVSEIPGGRTRTLVDAVSGEVADVTRIGSSFDGTGRVFDPNPVVTLRDESLLDSNDADTAALQSAYKVVPLTRLDGSGGLHGEFATIEQAVATSSERSFLYGRSDPRFEEVMAYFHVTSAQEYIQSLGFTDINNQPQRVRPNGFAEDNSYFDGRSIVLGSGGVDDAEDADIIWHEYGHAMQFDRVAVRGRDARRRVRRLVGHDHVDARE